MYGVTYNPTNYKENSSNTEDSTESNFIDNELAKLWETNNIPKITGESILTNSLTSKQETAQSATSENPFPGIKRLEIGYLDPKNYNLSETFNSNISNPYNQTTFKGSLETRKALESEIDKRGIDPVMRTFLLKSAVLESGMNLNPKNVPTGIHRGGAYKGQRFRALGMWQILNTNLKGLPISDEATYMSSLSNQLDNVLAMHEKSRAWLRNSGYLEKGLQKGYSEDELLYLMHHGWTGAVINMVDNNKSIGDVVNGADKGTAYTLSKYKQLKMD